MIPGIKKKSSDGSSQCHIDISNMNELLDVTDKNDDYMRAWIATRGHTDGTASEASDDEYFIDDNDDDRSIDYLANAISDFFRTVFWCGCPSGSGS
jgi:hypothetical protein